MRTLCLLLLTCLCGYVHALEHTVNGYPPIDDPDELGQRSATIIFLQAHHIAYKAGDSDEDLLKLYTSYWDRQASAASSAAQADHSASDQQAEEKKRVDAILAADLVLQLRRQYDYTDTDGKSLDELRRIRDQLASLAPGSTYVPEPTPPKLPKGVLSKVGAQDGTADPVSNVVVADSSPVPPGQIADISYTDLAAAISSNTAYLVQITSTISPSTGKNVDSYAANHIPNAVSYYASDFVLHLPLDVHRLMVVYSDNSGSAEWQIAADRLHKMGYLQVRCFRGGIQGWTEGGGALTH